MERNRTVYNFYSLRSAGAIQAVLDFERCAAWRKQLQPILPHAESRLNKNIIERVYASRKVTKLVNRPRSKLPAGFQRSQLRIGRLPRHLAAGACHREG